MAKTLPIQIVNFRPKDEIPHEKRVYLKKPKNGDIVIAYAQINMFQKAWVLGRCIDEHTILIDKRDKSILTKCYEMCRFEDAHTYFDRHKIKLFSE